MLWSASLHSFDNAVKPYEISLSPMTTPFVTTGALPGHALLDDQRSSFGLVGDVGGTNARFALAEYSAAGICLHDFQSLPTHDHPTFDGAIRAYLKGVGQGPQVLDFACLAVAGPIQDRSIKFTNLDWDLTEDGLGQITGARRVRLINDYEAHAYALPHWSIEDAVLIGPASEPGTRAYAIIGPGTGFGQAALIRTGHEDVVVSSEGGHVGFSPVSDRQVQILNWLVTQGIRPSVETLLSGPGLCRIHQALGAFYAKPVEDLSPAQIVDQARSEPSGICRETITVFLDILAQVAGDVALSYGATGGIFIGGGITPKLIDMIDPLRFRAAFEAKTPHESLMHRISVRVIVNAQSALIGCVHAMAA